MTDIDKTKIKYKVSYQKDGSLHVFYEEKPRGDAEEYCFGQIEKIDDRWGVVTHLRTGAYWMTKNRKVHFFAGEYGSFYWDDINTGEDFCEVVAAIEDGSAFIE